MKPRAAAAPAIDISVVVPCLNEAHNLRALLRLLDEAAARFGGSVEVIVVDGGSVDGTPEAVRSASPKFLRCVRLAATLASRAQQMNAGAQTARGGTLYFVHADTRPPLSCLRDVALAVGAGAALGTFATEFEGGSRLLRFNAALTTFNVLATRGGDQSIFIETDAFRGLGGYDAEMAIMEEYDLMRRARRSGHVRVLLRGRTLVSDRKYAGRSWARVQVANVVAVAMWRLGRGTAAIASSYARLLGEGSAR